MLNDGQRMISTQEQEGEVNEAVIRLRSVRRSTGEVKSNRRVRSATCSGTRSNLEHCSKPVRNARSGSGRAVFILPWAVCCGCAQAGDQGLVATYHTRSHTPANPTKLQSCFLSQRGRYAWQTTKWHYDFKAKVTHLLPLSTVAST